jgi:hypothetical protein
MKAALIGTLCGVVVSTCLLIGGFLVWQKTDVERETYHRNYIYMRSKATLLQGRVDMLFKENDNLRIDIQILRKEAPKPTPAPPKKINPC